jgi:hypothetical protein
VTFLLPHYSPHFRFQDGIWRSYRPTIIPLIKRKSVDVFQRKALDLAESRQYFISFPSPYLPNCGKSYLKEAISLLLLTQLARLQTSGSFMISPIQKTKTGVHVEPLQKTKCDDNCKIPARGMVPLKNYIKLCCLPFPTGAWKFQRGRGNLKVFQTTVFFFTFMFIPCILNNKCLLYTNMCTNKWCQFILKLLRHVSALIHHLQGVYKFCQLKLWVNKMVKYRIVVCCYDKIFVNVVACLIPG